MVFVRKINDKPHLRFCPLQRIRRSFAVPSATLRAGLRRTSLAQRLRQASNEPPRKSLILQESFFEVHLPFTGGKRR